MAPKRNNVTMMTTHAIKLVAECLHFIFDQQILKMVKTNSFCVHFQGRLYELIVNRNRFYVLVLYRVRDTENERLDKGAPDRVQKAGLDNVGPTCSGQKCETGKCSTSL